MQPASLDQPWTNGPGGDTTNVGAYIPDAAPEHAEVVAEGSTRADLDAVQRLARIGVTGVSGAASGARPGLRYFQPRGRS